MADKFMYIPNDDTQCTKFTTVPKVVKPTNKKTLLKTGD